ncbi:MAG: hypothetical protein J5784_02665, partial [Muribaculaceae bacterium]|nr:hypothetical protein [Muribaculaceae bacterium]
MKPYSRHQIEALLDKFMAGKTTIEEESLLSKYFNTTHDVPAEWEDFQALFGYIDRGLEGNLLPETSSPSHRKWLWWIPAATAAIVALVFGFKVLNKPETIQPISSPIITQKADPKDESIDQKTGNPHEAENESADKNISAPTKADVVTIKRQSRKQRHSLAVSHHEAQTNLIAQNEPLLQENGRLQRELEELNQRAIIIDMEAMGYQAVKDENGSI